MLKSRSRKKDFYPYLEEFKHERTKEVKSRLRLFCGLSVIIYIGIGILSIILSPGEFKKAELSTWAFLVVAAALILLINQKTRTLPQAKLNAFLFAAALVLSFVAVFLIYPPYIPTTGAPLLAICMFFISFIIPWGLMEVVAIGALHTAAYLFMYIWLNSPAAQALHIAFTPSVFTDGIIFLAVAFILCVIIRKRDDERQRENFVLFKKLEERNKEMEKELSLARDIHKTLIPQSTTTDKAVIAVNYIPVSTVGGDYATFHVTKEGNLFFLIGDVTGHGVPAALLVNRIYGETENLIARDYTPGVLLKELDRFVQRHFKQTQMYFSVCSGLIDFGKKKLFYSNYGHPPQILLQRRNNSITLLESQTYLLGLDVEEADARIFEGTLDFENKDRIVLFTDGLIETMGDERQLYGMERLEAFVKDHANDHPSLFNTDLLKDLNEFREGPVADDIFLLTIDIK